MKVIIIGSVAAGTSTAAKIRRNDEQAEIVVYDKGSYISYSVCGIPYYIGTEMEIEALIPRDEEWFKDRYQIEIKTEYEVIEVNYDDKEVVVKDLQSGDEKKEKFDKLVFATGARPALPPIKGIDKQNVFSVRDINDALNIKEYIIENKPKKATIVGSGFIGMEILENLLERNIEVEVIEMLPQIVRKLDREMAFKIEKYLESKGMKLYLSDKVTALHGEEAAKKVELESGQELETDLVIMATGIKPNTELAEDIGVKLGPTGAIKINQRMETNLADIYAVGDCAESFSLLTKEPLYQPLGSVANKMGRIAGDQITGGNLEFKGTLGTGIFKVLELSVGHTGLTAEAALEAGYQIEEAYIIKPNQPKYYPGGDLLWIKAIADKDSNRLLGVQIIGEAGVDKRIDVFATAITYGAKVEQLFHLDLAYAPPFATTKDPVLYTGMILNNALNSKRKLITPAEVKAKIKKAADELLIIDVRAAKQYQRDHLPGAINIPLAELRDRVDDLDKNKTVVTYCNKGTSGNAAQNILLNHGFEKVYNLAGGHQNYLLQKSL